MEETPEGLALAAAAREAIKAKKRALEDQQKEPAPKRTARSQTPCQHEVAIPEGCILPDLDAATYGTINHPVWDGEMAKAYPFQLDSFQATSIACIERKESVLVAAHTSAGKTVVAEYAIAKALKNKERVVYTSPLKALSNQKFRELSEEFEDVGLMTGDVTLNPNASCVVMTTEILRSMMYRGGELLREISWVVFDEVHYMQDRERGVVWEEVIISMPKGARMVFLSATLPNSLQFAEWIAAVHGAPCHVVTTDYRPTPLVHYGLPLGTGDGLYLLVDDKGRFRSENFKQMKATFKGLSIEEGGEGTGAGGGAGAGDAAPSGGRGGAKGGPSSTGKKDAKGKDTKTKGGAGQSKSWEKKQQQGDQIVSALRKLIEMIKTRNMQPVIVFSFSRRECEAYALALVSQDKGRKKGDTAAPPAFPPVDFNTAKEKASVAEIFNAAIQCLPEEDRELPVIKRMLPMLQRGIAVHHSGLLPILKELVEVMFQEQLIKCLFSTETFAMGLNMPAKTVVFTSMRKFDGQDMRVITSGEYIQMSGRAGRRGLDDRGYTIMLVDEDLDEESCKATLKGAAAPLLSSFKLSYYTLLNLLRRAEGTGVGMEEVISRSFSQFQHERRVPELEAQVEKLRTEAEKLEVPEGAVVEYVNAQQIVEKAKERVLMAMQQPDRCLHFLLPGRIVRIEAGGVDYGYGVVVSAIRDSSNQAAVSDPEAYLIDVLLYCKPQGATKAPAPCDLDAKDGEIVVIPAIMTSLTALSTLRISIPENLTGNKARASVLVTIREIVGKYPGGKLPELDPIQDMGVDEPEVLAAAAAGKAAQQKLELLSEQIGQTGVVTAGQNGTAVPPPIEIYRRKAELLAEIDKISSQIRKSQLRSFQEEAKNRGTVLRKLGHVDAEGVVTLKGRAACEVDTADELLTAEMMFNGTFGALDKHQLAALVSCLIQSESTDREMTKISPELAKGLAMLQQSARHIADVSKECKLEIDTDVYVQSFKASLMNIVYEWSKGATFAQLCSQTDMYEGTIIRALRRLDELMNNLEKSVEVVGDDGLTKLFKESRETMRRGLPFAASLYI